MGRRTAALYQHPLMAQSGFSVDSSGLTLAGAASKSKFSLLARPRTHAVGQLLPLAADSSTVHRLRRQSVQRAANRLATETTQEAP